MSRQIERKSANAESLPPELLLEVFAEPIMFHRCYVTLTGSVTAALVLSYASYATEEMAQETQSDGWFVKTVAQWQCDTGLTRTELESARRKLKAQGLWEERRHGPPPAPLQFRINQAALSDQLRAQALAQWGDLL
jgi:hypothetical protein